MTFFKSKLGKATEVVALLAGALIVSNLAVASATEHSSGTTLPTQYTGCLHKGVLSEVAIGSSPRVACSSVAKKVTWSAQGPAGANGKNGTNGLAGTNGTNGKDGKNGTNGTNGAGILTSAGVPTSACTSGDSDLNLSDGEVYVCVSGAWTDSGTSLVGPPGGQGAPGAAGVVEYTWSFDIPASATTQPFYFGSTNLLQGTTAAFVSGSVTVGTCADGAGAGADVKSGTGDVATWSSSNGTSPKTTGSVTVPASAPLEITWSCADGTKSVPSISGSVTFDGTAQPAAPTPYS